MLGTLVDLNLNKGQFSSPEDKLKETRPCLHMKGDFLENIIASWRV